MINRTTQFIMPLLFPYNYIDYFNCYLGLNELKDVTGKIYCVSVKEIPKKILSDIKNMDNYIGSTFVNNKQVLILSIKDEYEIDFNKFLVGNYKSIDVNTKRIIYKFWFDNYKQNDIFANITMGILYSLFDDEEAIEKMIYHLTVTDRDYDKIYNVLKQHNELESILKIEDEIYKIN